MNVFSLPTIFVESMFDWTLPNLAIYETVLFCLSLAIMAAWIHRENRKFDSAAFWHEKTDLIMGLDDTWAGNSIEEITPYLRANAAEEAYEICDPRIVLFTDLTAIAATYDSMDSEMELDISPRSAVWAILSYPDQTVAREWLVKMVNHPTGLVKKAVRAALEGISA